MASTFTPVLTLEKPGNGEQDGSWGDTVNANMDKIDTAIGERVKLTAASQTITGNVGVTGDVAVTGAFRAIGTTGSVPLLQVPLAGVASCLYLHNPSVNATSGRGVDMAFQASTGGASLGLLAAIQALSTTASNNTGTLNLYGVTAGTRNLGLTVKQDGTVLLPVKAEVGDVNFFANLPTATTPRLTFDTNDYYQYDRTANVHGVYVGGVLKLGVDASGPYRTDDAASANQLPRKSQLDAATAQATDTARGTVELATNAEVITGTDTARVVTPAALKNLFSSNQLLATDGYIKLPGGLIAQWARGAQDTGTGDPSQTINFPTAFPTAVLFVGVSTEVPAATTTTDIWYQTIAGSSLTSVSVQRQWTGSAGTGGNTRPIIFAIGY